MSARRAGGPQTSGPRRPPQTPRPTSAPGLSGPAEGPRKKFRSTPLTSVISRLQHNKRLCRRVVGPQDWAIVAGGRSGRERWDFGVGEAPKAGSRKFDTAGLTLHVFSIP